MLGTRWLRAGVPEATAMLRFVCENAIVLTIVALVTAAIVLIAAPLVWHAARLFRY